MPNESSLRGAEKNVQDWISLVCGALLFVSPWALGFAGDLTAARTAWVGGIVIGAMAIAALVQFAEWEEWVTLVIGLAVAVSPWVLGFAALHLALAVCVVLGLIVALASVTEIWAVRQSSAIARQ
jgi:SPW repeat